MTKKVPSINIAKQWRDVFEKDLPDMICRTEEVQQIQGNYEGLVSSPLVERYLDECYYCYMHGNFLAAIVMLCSAFEACFQKLINKNPKDGFRVLACFMYECQIISDSEHEQLKQLIKYRNEVVHTRFSRDSPFDTTKYRMLDYNSQSKKCSQHMKTCTILYRIHRNPFYYGELIRRITKLKK